MLKTKTRKFIEAREKTILYWLVQDGDGLVKGPYGIQPTDFPEGWTLFGVKADVLGRNEWR